MSLLSLDTRIKDKEDDNALRTKTRVERFWYLVWFTDIE